MKLYDSPFAPNPRRVRMFLAEKGISVPTEMVDLAKMQQKDPGFSALNPLQRIPVLELDSGEIFMRIRGDLPLFRGNPALAAVVWDQSARKGAGGNVAAPRRTGVFLSHRAGFPPQPSRHGGNGKAADRRTRRSQPAARPRLRQISSTANWPGGGLSRATISPSPTSPPSSPPISPSRRASNFRKTSCIWPVGGRRSRRGQAPRPDPSAAA